ncbi:MAG: UDP-2,3-diacylglucosamine diphosphatase, partial [Betaproteobacteria bacterium]
AILDVEERAVEAAFRAAKVSRMIHGPTHRPAPHHLVVDGRACERWVLADWNDTYGEYLEATPEGLRRMPLPP